MSFFDKIGEALACVASPIDCAIVGTANWLDAQSAIWVLAFGVVAGMILGAWLGWKGLAVLATGGALVFFMNRAKTAQPIEDDIWPDPDKPVRRSSQRPPLGKVTRTVFNSGPLANFFNRREKK